MEFGSAGEVLSHPLHPYTQDMIHAMPENGMRYDESGFAPSHEDYLSCAQGCRYRHRCRFQSEKCKEMPPVCDINGHKVRCWRYAAVD